MVCFQGPNLLGAAIGKKFIGQMVRRVLESSGNDLVSPCTLVFAISWQFQSFGTSCLLCSYKIRGTRRKLQTTTHSKPCFRLNAALCSV